MPGCQARDAVHLMAGLDGPGHAGALAIARFPDVGNALAVTAREGGRVALTPEVSGISQTQR